MNTSKQERLEKSNKILYCIATNGRQFFLHKGEVSKMELDKQGRVWFVDSFFNKRIYTHYESWRWRGFSEGGTLRDLILTLRDFITTGIVNGNPFGPWPEWYLGGDPWGYGGDMEKVREKARELGLLESKRE